MEMNDSFAGEPKRELNVGHTTLGLLAILTGAMVLTLIFPALRFTNSVELHTDVAQRLQGSKEALTLMKDWGVWMAGVQFATLAALGALAKDLAWVQKLSLRQKSLALWAVILNAAALFFSAWLLTALSSMMLRVHADNTKDIYERALYAFMETKTWAWLDGRLTLGFVCAWNHILWGAGIIAFGTFCASVFMDPPRGTPSPPAS